MLVVGALDRSGGVQQAADPRLKIAKDRLSWGVRYELLVSRLARTQVSVQLQHRRVPASVIVSRC